MARSKKTAGSIALPHWLTPALRARIAWVAGCLGVAILMLALGSFHHADWPSRAVAVHNEPTANLVGTPGAAVAFWTYAIFGYGTWFAVLLAAAALVAVPFGFRAQHLWLRTIGAALLVVSTGALHALWFPRLGPVAGIEAGLIPQWAAAELATRFSGFAASLILLCAATIGALVAADEVVTRLPGAVMKGLSFLEPVWKLDWAGMLGMRRAAPALAGAGANASPALRKAGAKASVATLVDEDESADNVRVDDEFDAAFDAARGDEDDAEAADEDADEDEDEDWDDEDEYED